MGFGAARLAQLARPDAAQESRDRGGDGRHRMLVVANETVGGEALLRGDRPALPRPQQRDPRRHAGAGRVARPALGLGHRRSDRAGAAADGALADRDRRGSGLRAKGEIGDSDPNIAIEDALRVFPADEIVISTHPPSARTGSSAASSSGRGRRSTSRSPTSSSTSPPNRASASPGPAPSSGSLCRVVALGSSPLELRGSRRPALATVQSIASQVMVATATWSQTSSEGSSRAHWTPPIDPLKGEEGDDDARGRRGPPVASLAAQEKPDGDRRQAEDRGDRRVALHHPFQRCRALEVEAVDELSFVGAGVRPGPGRDRPGEDRQLPERDQRPHRPDAEPVARERAARRARSASTRRARRRRRAAASRG